MVIRAVRGSKQNFSTVLVVKMKFLVFPAEIELSTEWNARNCISTVKTVEKLCLVPRTVLITLKMTLYISFGSFKHDPTDFEIFEFW